MTINKRQIEKAHKINYYDNRLDLVRICIIAGVKYDKFMRLVQGVVKAKEQRLLAVKNANKEDILKNRDAFQKQLQLLKDYSYQHLGIMPNVNYDDSTIYEIMSAKFTDMGITKRLYFDQILNSYVVLKQDPEGLNELKKAVESKGFTLNLFQKWLQALLSNDVKNYNYCTEMIGDMFADTYRDGDHDLNFKDAVQEAATMDYMFKGCENEFETKMINFLPEVLLVKVCLSQAMVKVYD
ncbi:hypothetical protein [Vibrio harveyi]|uniref:hypothetical protein n=1 Tax=Vibrio harveyi TaxID=669 RepID=UPI00237FFC5C|nr:hypothetical protein [Vibrio harveyi]